VLLVDDTLFRGTSIRDATRELRKRDIPYAVAVFLNVNNSEEDIERLKEFFQLDHLYLGGDTVCIDDADELHQPTPIKKWSEVSGVKRVEGYQLGHGRAQNRGIAQRDAVEQELINLSRLEIDHLVEELLSESDGRHKNAYQ
jgi:hypothetical protein